MLVGVSGYNFLCCVVTVNYVGFFRLDCYMALSVPYAVKVCDRGVSIL